MHTFDYRKYKEYTWDNEILTYVSQIHEHRGIQDFYTKQNKVELLSLLKNSIIQSTESSNSIEGIVTTKSRFKKLMSDKTTPINRDEEEILGYKKVLELIYDNYEVIPIKPSYILQLHREMLKYTPFSYQGKYKTTENEIAKIYKDGSKEILFTPLQPYEISEAVESLCFEFNKALSDEIVDPLILIPIFISDFLCIHPFTDGNGRMSRLLTLLLLYKSGYKIFISIENFISNTREEYYSALHKSDQGWHKGQNDPNFFIKYMLKIILVCYKELEKRITLTKKDSVKKTSYDIVKEYISNTLGKFSKQDVLSHCFNIKSSSVESALKKLVDEGTLKKIGLGKNTQYIKVL